MFVILALASSVLSAWFIVYRRRLNLLCASRWRPFSEMARRAFALPDGYYLTGLLGIWLCLALKTLSRGKYKASRPRTIERESPSVRMVRTGSELEIPIDALQAGDTVIVRSGEIVPIDGIIVAGSAWVEVTQSGMDSRKEVKKVNQAVSTNHLVLAGCIFVQAKPAVG